MSEEPTDLHEQPTLEDVLDVEEPVKPHRREHAKAAPRPDEEELDEKVQVEREEVGLGDDD
ncbi:MAG: hypothetical protein ACRDVW_11005 [Acidimicrobiales bacterium]